MSAPHEEDRRPQGSPETPDDPIGAARRYGRPDTGYRSTRPNLPKSGVARSDAELGKHVPGPIAESSAPRILGIIGIACAFILGPAGLVLGVVGHYIARKRGQSAALPRLAWILSIALTLLGVLINIAAHSLFRP